MKSILFVCLGNICRSPMAEGLMKRYADENGGKVTIDSAATSRWEVGNPPHRGTQQILKRAGVSTKGMTARQITSADFQRFDLIVGMDLENVADLQAMAPAGTENKVFNYLSVVSGKERSGIPDPWYTGDFEETYRLISEGLPGWWAKLQEG